MTSARCLWPAVVLVAVLAACSVATPVDSLQPAGVGAYIATRHPPTLLVTDSAGQSRWVHEPKLDGDTLRGVRSKESPRWPVAIPVRTITRVAVPRFSSARTIGLVAGIAAALGYYGWRVGTGVDY